MKHFVVKILNLLARRTVKRFRPKVVGITGSVGKTSTKEAVLCVLKNSFNTRANVGSYNNEFGLPLTILGFSSPGKNIFKWVPIIFRSFVSLFQKDYPEILVLEMGADKPGDIKSLLAIIGKLDVAVITDIGISHLEKYPNFESLSAEKMSIVEGLEIDGTVVLNCDNPELSKQLPKIATNKISYGLTKGDLMASGVSVTGKTETSGLSFDLNYRGKTVPCLLPGSLGLPNVYAAMAAVSVALAMGLSLEQAALNLKNFSGPAGRLKLLKGIKRTWIIDDTYNAAPASTLAALDVLNQISDSRKIAVLGGMEELGSENISGHKQVAEKLDLIKASVAVLVGNKGRIIQEELMRRKFAGKILWFETSDDAKLPVQELIAEGDTILIKGSQAARMEKVVKEIMAQPMLAEKLLVRQSETWLKK
ncbi:MAG: UDP-N-acetylmuramoyl-tripeptide--D-alanyl-D-alanine ligase [Acidobacteriaceae bacterium]